MPTYTSSPFSTNLQSYLFKGLDVDVIGHTDCIGTPASVYVIHISNGDAANRYLGLWDSASLGWGGQDCLIRVQASTEMTIYIDKGIPFDTAITIGATRNNDGVGDPTDFDIDLFATP